MTTILSFYESYMHMFIMRIVMSIANTWWIYVMVLLSKAKSWDKHFVNRYKFHTHTWTKVKNYKFRSGLFHRQILLLEIMKLIERILPITCRIKLLLSHIFPCHDLWLSSILSFFKFFSLNQSVFLQFECHYINLPAFGGMFL